MRDPLRELLSRLQSTDLEYLDALAGDLRDLHPKGPIIAHWDRVKDRKIRMQNLNRKTKAAGYQ